MSSIEIPPVRPGSLVLYKMKPAVVLSIDTKFEIELESGKTVKVRAKDIELIHPGPVSKLSEVIHGTEAGGEIGDACEMLYGEMTTVEEFSELAFGEWTPESAWSVCRLLQDGLYMTGSPWEISVRTQDSFRQELALRDRKAAEREEWDRLIQRIRSGQLAESDREQFFDVENLAFGKSGSSRIMRALGMREDPVHAHSLLMRLGVWNETVNPYISRMGFDQYPDYASLPPVPDEERVDLTHLQAFAIDDEGSKDPDDAISIDGELLWIHVADVASAVTPGSPADAHARSQGATLYLPEGAVTMLPPEATEMFGLGLQETSPALSFGVLLAADGSIEDVKVCRTRIRVTRTTYRATQGMLSSSPLKDIYERTLLYQTHRTAAGAIELALPEVKIRVGDDGKVVISQLERYPTQTMVSNAMIMAGEAAAIFAVEHEIPFPFTTQMPPDRMEYPQDLAGMFAFRRRLHPSAVRTAPDVHAGLGVPCYSRATSPLRRYLDLLAHQQLRAFLQGEELMDIEEILVKSATASESARLVQQLERASNFHWKLVYLSQNQGWRGTGILVDIRKDTYTFLIPELALETQMQQVNGVGLNDRVELAVDTVDIPYGRVLFTIL